MCFFFIFASTPGRPAHPLAEHIDTSKDCRGWLLKWMTSSTWMFSSSRTDRCGVLRSCITTDRVLARLTDEFRSFTFKFCITVWWSRVVNEHGKTRVLAVQICWQLYCWGKASSILVTDDFFFLHLLFSVFPCTEQNASLELHVHVRAKRGSLSTPFLFCMIEQLSNHQSPSTAVFAAVLVLLRLQARARSVSVTVTRDLLWRCLVTTAKFEQNQNINNPRGVAALWVVQGHDQENAHESRVSVIFSLVVLTSRGSLNARERKRGSWFVEEPPKVVVVVVCGCSFCEEI